MEGVANQETLKVLVVDNGLGIKESHRKNMFKLFGTFRDLQQGINPKGIGLGLCICKHIVQKMNGRIDYLTRENEGTTFFFTIETLKAPESD